MLLLPPRSAVTEVSETLTGKILNSLQSSAYQISGKERWRESIHSCSAIHFQGWFIRQVSCYTLLSGFRLPWPPSCCQDETTPFVVSVWLWYNILALQEEHPLSPFLLTKTGPRGFGVVSRFRERKTNIAHSKFDDRPRASAPGISRHRLYCTKPQKPNPAILREISTETSY